MSPSSGQGSRVKPPRVAERKRSTKETEISVRIDLDGSGKAKVSTGIPFFDHMLEQIGRHGGFDLELTARGDLDVDTHHTIEDTGIVLGAAFAEALGDKAGVRVETPPQKIGTFDPQLAEEFFRAFVTSAGITLHLKSLAGKNGHHIIEASFKGVARALRDAVRVEGGDIPSTKEVL